MRLSQRTNYLFSQSPLGWLSSQFRSFFIGSEKQFPASDVPTKYSGLFRESCQSKLSGQCITLPNTPVALLAISSEGQIIDVNPALEDFSGVPKATMTEKYQFDYVHPEDIGPVKNLLARVKVDQSRCLNLILRFRKKDGSYCWCDCQFSPITNMGVGANTLFVTLSPISANGCVNSGLGLASRISPDLTCLLDKRGNLIDYNPVFSSFFAESSENRGEMNFVSGVVEADRYFVSSQIERLGRFGGEISFKSRCLDGQGELREVAWTGKFDESNNLIFFSGRDITENRKAYHRLKLLDRAFSSTGEAIVITDHDNKIVEVNGSFERITGYPRYELIGRSPSVTKSGRHDELFYKEMWHSLENRGSWQGEIWDRRKNGEIYPKWLSINVVKNEHNEITNYVGVFSDISLIKEAERRLEQLAHYDQLTGLPNRVLFQDHLANAMVRADRRETICAIMFIDLDGFKEVNDTQGHSAGDALLKETAEKLKQCIRKEDIVSRIGGDEFAVIVRDLQRVNPIQEIAQKILSSLNAVSKHQEMEVRTSASIGIALYPQDGQDAETLLCHADHAMYEAKKGGKNRFQFFEHNLHERLVGKIKIQSLLRDALERDELFVVYQPKIDLKSRSLSGLEALVRWDSPVMGLVSPAEFIPVAEESGLIIPLGRYVLEQACRHMMEIAEQEMKPISVAVNLSSRQFNYAGTVRDIDNILKKTGFPPELLEIELTESLVMDDIEHTIKVLRQLKAMGVKVAIDDFGTGYSSLNYLKKLPVDNLKIDMSFIKDVPDDQDDVAIVTAIISMAHRLHLRVVAEGVEHLDQYRFLVEQECDEIQGFLISAPVAGKALLNHLDTIEIP